MFTYICGGVQWSAVGSSSNIAVVGYNAAGARYFNHHLSGYSSVGDALSCAVGKRRKRQDGSDGTTFYIDIQTIIGRCLEMVQLDTPKYSPSKLNEFVNKLEPCPCTRMQAKADTARFRQQNHQCFISMKPITASVNDILSGRTVSLVRECCYDGRYYRK